MAEIHTQEFCEENRTRIRRGKERGILSKEMGQSEKGKTWGEIGIEGFDGLLKGTWVQKWKIWGEGCGEWELGKGRDQSLATGCDWRWLPVDLTKGFRQG